MNTALIHELAALLDNLGADDRRAAARIFIDAILQLDTGDYDAMQTVAAAAQVTVKAYASVARAH
jgi:hypothetical protein